MRGTAALGLVVALGCGPAVTLGDEGTGGSSDSSAGGITGLTSSPGTTTTAGTTAGTTATTTSATSSTSATTATTTSDTAETVGFLDSATTECFTHCTAECDVWQQDCPAGEKCTPWANDGGNSWNALRCVPIEPFPGQPGEVCTVEGSGVSGIDSCDLGALCWNVDPETNTGYCIAMCTGSPEVPSCAGACDTCALNNDGVLNLCLQQCHPAHHECRTGEACAALGDTFACAPWSGAAAVLDACDDTTDCADGLACVGAAQVPGCIDASCCTPVCDVTADDCAAQLPGTTCAPTGFEVPGCITAVGLCVSPG